jgi:hypothetical protein
MQRFAAATFVLLLAVARPAEAQWPTVLMFHGGGLEEPIFVTGADSAALGSVFRPATPGVRASTAAEMGSRSYFDVACFWGPASDPAVNGTRRLADLRPEMAWQHARFYPAVGDQPAAVFVTSMEKKVLVRGSQTGQPQRASSANAAFRGVPPPTDAGRFTSSGLVSTDALTVLERLGVPVRNGG